jgi:hypothetical protein
MFKIGASLHPRHPLWSVHHHYPRIDETNKNKAICIIYLISKRRYLESDDYVEEENKQIQYLLQNSWTI